MTRPRNGKEVKLKEFLEQMKGTPEEKGNLPRSDRADTQAQKDRSPGDIQTSGGAADPKGKGKGKDKDPGTAGDLVEASSGGQKAVDATDITRDTTRAQTKYQSFGTMAENPSESDKEKDETTITVGVYRMHGKEPGEVVVRIRNVPVVVKGVSQVKKGRSRRIDIVYLTRTAKPLDLGQWLPGGVITPGSAVPGSIFKSTRANRRTAIAFGNT